MPKISTRNARVRVTSIANGQVLNIKATRWSVEVRSDEIDVTNFETGGFAEFLTGYVEAAFSCDGFYETTGSPYTPDLGATAIVSAGNFIALRMYQSRATGLADFFDFPKAFIITATGDAAVRDAARVSFTGKNFGTFTYPGGLVFSGVEPS